MVSYFIDSSFSYVGAVQPKTVAQGYDTGAKDLSKCVYSPASIYILPFSSWHQSGKEKWVACPKAGTNYCSKEAS